MDNRLLDALVRRLAPDHGRGRMPTPTEPTAVHCSLRGFAAYAEAVPGQVVAGLLEEYHQRLRTAAETMGGTVEHRTNDSVLVLVGEPPGDDPVPAGLALGRCILEVVREVTTRWATIPHPLGVGVGVASGPATSAADVAARLSSAAADGQVLVDDGSAALCGALV